VGLTRLTAKLEEELRALTRLPWADQFDIDDPSLAIEASDHRASATLLSTATRAKHNKLRVITLS
jgi:hypothetical protein